MKRKVLLLGSCILAALASHAGAIDPGEPSSLKKADVNGGVCQSQSGRPLGNVSVTAYRTARKEKVAHTDSRGNYAFDDLQPGRYKFVFEKDGYKKVTREKVVVKTDEGYQMDIEMIKEKDFIFLPGTFGF